MVRQLLIRFAVVWSATCITGCVTSAVTDLGSLGGGSVGLGINSAGNVTGSSFLSSSQPHFSLHAFRYVDGLGMLDLGALPGADISEGGGINDNGQVCGGSVVPGFVPHAILVTATLDLVDLGTLGGEFSFAADLNNQVQVTGESSTTDLRTRAFLWTSTSGMEDLGSLGGTQSAGRSINESGQVAGESKLQNNFTVRAFRYSQGVGMVDLGTLGGTGNSSGYGINDTGQVVGESDAERVLQMSIFGPLSFLGGKHAFLWTEGVGMIDLGHLGGGVSRALAINNHGVVVGYSKLANDSTHAFRWTEEEGMIDLNTLLPSNSDWVLLEGADINDKGQIAGTGRHNGVKRAFRFNPTTTSETP